MSYAVEIRQLTKKYGDFVALDQVNLCIEAGMIYGLLGRNGAGKTTLMRIITSQLLASSGEVKVFGESPYENNHVLSRICFVQENQAYPDHFRVRDVLAVAPRFFPNWDQDYARALVADFQLPLKQRVKKLSRGMRSALGIVIGLASRAPLTILDEPYLGLDAVARERFYNHLIEDYMAHTRTIVLSTHLIDEVSQILNHVAVIDRGRILIDERIDTLRSRAYTVAGAKHAVEHFAAGKNVIQRAALGGLATATILGDWNPQVRQAAEEHNLEFTPVSLQQLIVHLTEGNAVNVGAEIS